MEKQQLFVEITGGFLLYPTQSENVTEQELPTYIGEDLGYFFMVRVSPPPPLPGSKWRKVRGTQSLNLLSNSSFVPSVFGFQEEPAGILPHTMPKKSNQQHLRSSHPQRRAFAQPDRHFPMPTSQAFGEPWASKGFEANGPQACLFPPSDNGDLSHPHRPALGIGS